MDRLKYLATSVKIGLAIVLLLGIASFASLLVAFAVLAVANSVFSVGITASTVLVIGAALPLVWWLSFGLWRKVASIFWD